MIPPRSCSLMMLGFLLAGMVMSANVAVALDVGAPAPDFTLQHHGRADQSESVSRKKLVLLEFYGVDFAPT